MAQPVVSHGDSSVSVTLPDGKLLTLLRGATGKDAADAIGKRLAAVALAYVSDGQQRDLSVPLTHGARIEIITAASEAGVEILRHDTAHLLAHAVTELYPDAKPTIGPVIEDGFFYDFYREVPFSDEDFPAIEAKMREIAARALPVTREEVSRDEAIARFSRAGERFKVELTEAIPEGEAISIYHQGGFSDLCRGPHADRTDFPKVFKLLKVSGAYWRGDSKNPMLQRIYGTAWPTQKELDAYLHRVEEAEKRDHRKLGAQMELFHLQEEAQGQAFWHPKGWTLYRCLENYIRSKITGYGYQEIKTPILLSRTLWEKSGHWEKFGDMIFSVHSEKEEPVAVKPMSCPGHVQVYNKGIKSYRDLPLRIAEFGHVHRNEPSGSLHGLMRARGFTQDDGHIFCAESQLEEEIVGCCNLIRETYADLGFTDVYVKFSDRPAKRAGEDDVWDRAEAALESALKKTGMDYGYNRGEGAFYGPKLEFVLRDAIGRHWQCGTVQADFVLPERLDAVYIDSEGKKRRPVFVHRAVLGSFERFIGILLEHYAGAVPLWMAPVQAVSACITEDSAPYAEHVKTVLLQKGIRAESDVSSEKIGYKIRLHSHLKTPIILAVGKKEQEAGTVSVRRLGAPDQRVMTLDECVAMMQEECRMPA